MQPSLAGTFPAYTGFAPRVPVYCVTPGRTGCIHRYCDSSPFSPSGRYFAVTRLPFEDRLPKPGDVAEIAVVDLETRDRMPYGVRLDPHPAWDRSYTSIACNACPDGRRRVFVADLRGLLAAD